MIHEYHVKVNWPLGGKSKKEKWRFREKKWKRGKKNGTKLHKKQAPPAATLFVGGKKWISNFFFGGGTIIEMKNIYRCRCIMDFLLIDQLTLVILGEILKFLTIQTVVTHVYLLHYAYFYDYDPFTFRTFIFRFLWYFCWIWILNG